MGLERQQSKKKKKKPTTRPSPSIKASVYALWFCSRQKKVRGAKSTPVSQTGTEGQNHGFTFNWPFSLYIASSSASCLVIFC
jgi:hypothetical protein